MSDTVIFAVAQGWRRFHRTGTAPVVSASAADVALVPAPIPAHWVLSGHPEARSAAVARARDGGASMAVWECTSGTFRWRFDWDEAVHIVDGGVTVTEETGAVRVLRAGDVAFFPAGSTAVWEVADRVRKVAFFHQPVPRTLTFAMRLFHYVRRMLSEPRR